MLKKTARAPRPRKHGRHFVYILRCANGALYTGYTTDVRRRLEELKRKLAAEGLFDQRPACTGQGIAGQR